MTMISRNKNIFISEDCPALPFFEIELDHFFNKTTVIYGKPKTGKSFIITAVLYELKTYIPNIIVICPTDSSSQAYSRRVPKGCIHERLTAPLLQAIIKRQKIEMKRHGIVNDMKNLKSLFDKLRKDVGEQQIYDTILQGRLNSMYTIDNMNTDYAHKLELRSKIKITANEQLTILYKMAIARYDWSNHKLSKIEDLIITYLNHNPYLILIMDDVTAQMKDKTIKELLITVFTNVRWLGVSVVIALHGDTSIIPLLRTTAFTSIFTDDQNATLFFKKESIGATKEKKDIVKTIINVIFKKDRTRYNFKKLVFTSETLPTETGDGSQFHYAHVQSYEEDDFKVGSKQLWQLCNAAAIKLEDDDEIFANMSCN